MTSSISRTSSISDISNENPPDKFSETLFGRKDEFLSLAKTYQKVNTTRSYQKVSVYGDSGTGKTSLVAALQVCVIADNGLFCTGKYFQYPNLGREPYSAIMAAFSDLCDLILQSKDFNEERRAMIEEELGPDGKLLRDLVTNISPFLGIDCDQPYTQSISDTNAAINYCSAAELKHACKSFVRAMCSSGQPVVIFIDDIQWMDEGSKELLEALLRDTSINNLMLILAYRDGECFSVKDVFVPQIDFDLNVWLKNLHPKCVEQIVSTELRIATDLAPSNISGLCNLVAHRTNGNPFHVKQFIKLIKAQKLVVYDNQSRTWQCDVDTIQRKTMINESIAELLSKKVNLLDESTKQVLKIMSLLGYCFTHRMVVDFCSDVGQEGKLTLQMIMDKAVTADLIEKTRDGYKFTHDKIQGTFQGIMKPEEKEKLHFMIGHKFLTRSNLVFKYAAAIHLNCSTSHFSDSSESIILLARVNFQASKYCESKYAFSEAISFVREGLSILGEGEEKWVTNFEVACSLTESLSKLEMILGHTAACRRANREILSRDISEKSKINALFREISVMLIEDDSLNPVTAGKNILSQFVTVPRVITPLRLFSKIYKVRRAVDSKETNILTLPRMNPDLVCAQKTILLTSLYFLLHKKYMMMLYTDMLGVEFMMTNGLCDYSANILFHLAKVEMLLGRKERNYRLAKLALQLIPRDAPAHVVVQAHFAYSCVCAREQFPIEDSFLFTPKVLNGFLEQGNNAVAILVGWHCFLLRYFMGEHLEASERSIRAICERLRALDQRRIAVHYHILLQFTLNLQDEDERDWEKLTVFTGECMDERESFASLSLSQMCFIYYTKLIVAYTFGFYEKAEKMIEKTQINLVQRKMLLWFPFHLYSSLTFFALYEQTGDRSYLRKARKCRKRLQCQHSEKNVNATPYLRVAEAVELSLKPGISLLEVCLAFDEAIKIQSRKNLAYLEALASELAGFALSRMEDGVGNYSKMFLRQALDIYKNKLGAIAKYRWLKTKMSSK